MDASGLLTSIAATASALDELRGSYNSTSSTIDLIRAQISILQITAERVEQWLQSADSTSKTKVSHSLQDAIGTVDSAVKRLQDDVDGIMRTGPRTARMLGKTGSDQWVKTKVAYSDIRMRKHLGDVRECVALMHFSLDVCHLPVGRSTEREAQELEMGARTLHRAQTSARRERLSAIQQSGQEHYQENSPYYDTFLRSVNDAEADIPEDAFDGLDVPPYEEYDRESAHATSDRSHTLAVEPQPTSGSGNSHSTSSLLGSSIQALERTVSPDANGTETIYDLSKPVERSPPVVAAYASVPAGQPREYSDPPYANTNTLKQIRRKPVSRASISAVDRVGEPSSSTTDQTRAMAEKIEPLTQSLQSLNTSDYLSIELEHATTQPYSDEPPSYAATAPVRSPTLPMGRPRRVDTAMSAQIDDLTPPIIILAREDRSAELSKSIEQGININEVDTKTGRTAIMEAARLKRWEVCRILLIHKCHLHLKDARGNTALHLGAREGDAEICKTLLDAGAQLEDHNLEGTTPLEYAARGRHTETVLCLLNHLLPRKPNDPAVTKAFLEAIKLGDIGTAQVFVGRFMEPRKLKESWKLIANAAISGSIPMLEFILAQKISIKERNIAGWTALHFAARHGHTFMVQKILSLKLHWRYLTYPRRETALHLAIQAGHPNTALALIADRGAVVSIADTDGHEPIHHAIRNGDLRLTSALLEKGAKLKSESRYGWKPIHLAAAYGHTHLIAECITRGTNIEEKTSTPSFKKPDKRTNEGARRGYLAEIRWPHPSSRPLHLALEFGHDSVATMLINGGAKLDEEDAQGWRPLHHAAFSCRPAMVLLLLQRGVTPHATTADGNTALSLGVRAHGLLAPYDVQEEIADMLRAAMSGQKKSKLKHFTEAFTSGPGAGRGKGATARDLAWHKAYLAEVLHSHSEVGDEEEAMDDASVSGDEGEWALRNGGGEWMPESGEPRSPLYT